MYLHVLHVCTTCTACNWKNIYWRYNYLCILQVYMSLLSCHSTFVAKNRVGSTLNWAVQLSAARIMQLLGWWRLYVNVQHIHTCLSNVYIAGMIGNMFSIFLLSRKELKNSFNQETIPSRFKQNYQIGSTMGIRGVEIPVKGLFVYLNIKH